MKLTDKSNGFTMVEVLIASMIVAFTATGIWGIYWSIINTYQVEIRDSTIHAEGEHIMDLIANGGYYNGKKIYGLSSMSAVSPEPALGVGTDTYFTDDNDYRIGFLLDDNEGLATGNTRYAQFYVEFNPGGNPKSKLYFKLKTDNTGGDAAHNYTVKITENLLQKKSGTDASAFGSYDETWLKAHKLPSDTGYCSGVNVSFYLMDADYPLQYNYKLDRELINPIGNPDQERSYLNGIPYPKYFSRTIFIESRK